MHECAENPHISTRLPGPCFGGPSPDGLRSDLVFPSPSRSKRGVPFLVPLFPAVPGSRPGQGEETGGETVASKSPSPHDQCSETSTRW